MGGGEAGTVGDGGEGEEGGVFSIRASEGETRGGVWGGWVVVVG